MTEFSRPKKKRAEPQKEKRFSLRSFRYAHPGLTGVVAWLLLVALALIGTAVLRANVVQAYYVTSTSMLPTLESGDRVFANKLSYSAHDINRGDVVIIDRSSTLNSLLGPGSPTVEVDDLIKRVIALSGETIRIQNCEITIDGLRLEEPYLAEVNRNSRQYQRECIRKPVFELEIPPDHIFVMGDNRLNSIDSRIFGPIPENSVVARSFVKVWPFWRISLL